MSSTVEEVFEAPKGKYLVDFYGDWSRAEGVPAHATNAPLDLKTIATGDWKRFGLRGAVCDLAGDCDFLSVFLVEPSTTWSAPQRHLYEEVCYVVCGEGETEIDLGDGRKQLMPWRQGSLFSAPMNASYRHRATTGAPTRLACANDLRYLLNLYRSESFIFSTPVAFPERGEGEVVHDLAVLPVGKGLWAGERSTSIALAHGSIGVDVIELPVGTYGQARRQVYGSLLLCISGEGMSVSFEDARAARLAVAWKAGTIFAPAGLLFHQHFNTGPAPARLLRIEFGSSAHPILRPRMRAYGDISVYASGNAEITFDDEAPDIRREWLALLQKAGVKSCM